VSSPHSSVINDGFQRPVPVPTEISEPYWAACREGRLIYQRCGTCGTAVFPPQAFCPRELHLALDWQESAGLGSVYSFTIVERPQTPAFRTPYVVAVVTLDEGYEMMTNILGCEPADVHTGLRVRVEFEHVTEEISLPCFRPDRAAVR
jgi:uncharacterized OB-fold protein